MEINLLEKFGMTPTEAKVYSEIAKISETTIGPIIKKTGLHRGTVYNCINSLSKKGFLSCSNRSGVGIYKITGKKVFDIMLSQKKEEVAIEMEELQNLFENFLNSKKESNNEAEIIYGLNGFKKLFLDMYEECNAKKSEYLFLGEGGKMTEAVGQPYYQYTQDLKKKMKIECRIILSKESKNLSYRKYTFGDIRYLPTKISSPVNFWIYEDKVVMVLWDSKPLISIKLSGKGIADGFRNYFEYLWTLSR